MTDRQELRDELAGLLREHRNEVADTLEEVYARDYPRSVSNSMDASAIREWTLAVIETIALVIQSGDLDLFTYKNSYGDAVTDPADAEFALFASFVSSTLHEARTIAPLIFRWKVADSRGAHELLGLFESCMQQLVVHSCAIYAETVSAPGYLSSKWNLQAGLRPNDAAEDTLAKRYGRTDAGQPPSTVAAVPAPNAERPLGQPRSGEALTGREQDVLRLLLRGLTNREIAADLGLSANTVKNHVSRLFDKYAANNRAELVAAVLQGPAE